MPISCSIALAGAADGFGDPPPHRSYPPVPRLLGAGHQVDRLAVRGLERKRRDQFFAKTRPRLDQRRPRQGHAEPDGAGPLACVLGPADWTHGIARPFQNVVADPNPNLTVQLFRPPAGEWVGVRAQTRWRPAAGIGTGSGVLLDVHGEIGRVSMSVILVPFPKAEPASPQASAPR